MGLSGIGSTGSVRINTRSTQPRTSSNRTFQEQFRGGLKGGVDMTNNALRYVGKSIPGTAALSATLSDAARNLGSGSRLDSMGSVAGSVSDGDSGSLQDEMLRNNHEMLEQQMRISQITTSYSTRSYILKAMFDALKTIGSNIR